MADWISGGSWEEKGGYSYILEEIHSPAEKGLPILSPKQLLGKGRRAPTAVPTEAFSRFPLSNGFSVFDFNVFVPETGRGPPFSRTLAKKEWSDERGRTHRAEYSLPDSLAESEGKVSYRTIGFSGYTDFLPEPAKILSEHSIEVILGNSKERGYKVTYRQYYLAGNEENLLKTETLSYSQYGDLLSFEVDGKVISDPSQTDKARAKYFQSRRKVNSSEVLRKLSRVFSGELEIKQVRELGHARLR